MLKSKSTQRIIKEALQPRNIKDDVQESLPLQVLLIVDSIYWVIGNFAEQAKRRNETINFSVCSAFALEKALKRFSPLTLPFDVLHYLYGHPIEFHGISLPTVTTLHHKDSKTKINIFFKSDAVMTVSGQWHSYLMNLGLGQEKALLVPFGVDILQFTPPTDKERETIRAALKIPNEAFVVGFSGKSTSDRDNRKDLNCFIDGLKKLRQNLPNLTTLLVGPGWRNFSKYLIHEGIHCIQSSYHLNHQDISQYYRVMDVYWITSKIEGGPVPLLEAMASGVPCLSTPVGAALDLIEHGSNGFICAFNSPNSFANLSLKLSQNPSLKRKIGEAGRTTIASNREWNIIQKKLPMLYELAIKNFSGGYERQGSFKKITMPTCSSSKGPLPSANLLDSNIQNWIQACEHIKGLKMALKLREWKAAFKLSGLALATSPSDPYVWRDLVKTFIRQCGSFSSKR